MVYVCPVSPPSYIRYVDSAVCLFFQATDNMYSRAYVEPSETLSDCLFADENEECSDAEVDVEATDICPSSQSFGDLADLLPQQEVCSVFVALCVIHLEVTVIARIACYHSSMVFSLSLVFKWHRFTLL
jgi:hypothetical protein